MAEFIIDPNKPNNNIEPFRNTPSREFLREPGPPDIAINNIFGGVSFDRPVLWYFKNKDAANSAVSSTNVRVNNFSSYTSSTDENSMTYQGTVSVPTVSQGSLGWCSISSIALSVVSQLNFEADVNRFINCIPSSRPVNYPILFPAQKLFDGLSSDSQEDLAVSKAFRKVGKLLFDNVSVPIHKISNYQKCLGNPTTLITNNDNLCEIDGCIMGYVRLSNVRTPNFFNRFLGHVPITNQEILNQINNGSPVSISFGELYTGRLILVNLSNGDISWEDTSVMTKETLISNIQAINPSYDIDGAAHQVTITGATGPDQLGRYTFDISNTWGDTSASLVSITTLLDSTGSPQEIINQVWEEATDGYSAINGITFDVNFMFTPSTGFNKNCEYCEKFCYDNEYEEANGQVYCLDQEYDGVRTVVGDSLGVPLSVENFCDCVCDHPKKTYDADLQTCICDPNLAGPCEGVDNPLSLKLYNDSCDCVCQPENATQYCANQEGRVFDSETCSCVVAYGAWCTIYEACDDNFYITGCDEGTLEDWTIANSSDTAQNFNIGKTCAEISCIIDPSPTCTLSNTPTPTNTSTSTPAPTSTSTSTPNPTPTSSYNTLGGQWYTMIP
jgi:hypothetical protein